MIHLCGISYICLAKYVRPKQNNQKTKKIFPYMAKTSKGKTR